MSQTICHATSSLRACHQLSKPVLPIELPDDFASDLERRVMAANGAEKFTVDLRSQTISGPGGADIAFDISDADRTRLLEGLNDIGMSLKEGAAIAAWEENAQKNAPWLQRAQRMPGTEPAR